MEIKAPQDVLEVWFGETENKFRNALEERIEPLFDEMQIEKFEHWKENPEGRLALILCYDQAPRHLFEGTAHMYGFDWKAQELTSLFVEDGSYKALTPKQQMFIFLPYHHAENLECQRIAKPVFEGLAKKDDSLKWIAESSANYNRIIERFGRFPHRNLVLGRETTREEWEYLVNEYYDAEELKEMRAKALLPKEYWGKI